MSLLTCLSCRSTDGHLIRVEQGREPSHFVRMFGGTLIIVRGGKKFMLDESKQKLYQVMQVGRNEDQFRVEQMEADAINLNSDYVFILVSITVELTWVWRGRGAREVEISEAERMAKLMYPYSITSIEEGQEPRQAQAVHRHHQLGRQHRGHGGL